MVQVTTRARQSANDRTTWPAMCRVLRRSGGIVAAEVKEGTVRCLGVGNRGTLQAHDRIATLIEQAFRFRLMTWTSVV